jgi:hypothetical protein
VHRDLAYLQRRIVQEREAAASARTASARKAHGELARWYERMLTDNVAAPKPAEPLPDSVASAR